MISIPYWYAKSGGIRIRLPMRCTKSAVWQSWIARVPLRHRTYEGLSDLWWFDASLLPQLESRLAQMGYVLVHTAHRSQTPPHTETPPQPTTASPEQYYRRLHLQPDAPPELVSGAFRILSRIYHPDLSTSESERLRCEEKMKLITEAYHMIKGATHDPQATPTP